MRVACYARVSSSRQEQERTIDSQLEALRAYAAAHGHDLAPDGVFRDDGVSGARLDRPGLDQLRDAAEAHRFEAVLVLAPDRL
jgi:site-specific DNA recombinase